MKKNFDDLKKQLKLEIVSQQQAAANLLKEVSVRTENISKFSDMVVRAIDEALNKASQQNTLELKLKSIDGSCRDIKYGVLNEVRELQKAASYLKGRIEAFDKAGEILEIQISSILNAEIKVEELAQKMKSGELEIESAKKGNKRNPGQRPERLKNLREAKKMIDEEPGDVDSTDKDS